MPAFYERYWEGDKEALADFDLKWPVLSAYIPKDEGIALLDFGCGKGHILSAIAKWNSNAKLAGCDVSETALQTAHAKMPNVAFHKIVDGGPIPLPDATVDFVFSSEVIEHVYDTENAVREIARVLRSGGKFLVTVPYHGFFKNLALVCFGFDTHFDPTGGHIRFFSKKSLTALLEKNGLMVQKYAYYGRVYPFSHSIVVLATKK